MRSTLLRVVLAALLVGCGGKVVFVGDGGAAAAGEGEGGGRPDPNAWRADCPGFFAAPACPAECPISIASDSLPYCTNACVDDTPTGCAVGATCQNQMCTYPCDDIWDCAGNTGCTVPHGGGMNWYCAPAVSTTQRCGPFVAGAAQRCDYPCLGEVALPDGSTLCTSRCNDVETCVVGTSCRLDFAELDFGDHPCIPNCFVDADCPGGLLCDTQRECSPP